MEILIIIAMDPQHKVTMGLSTTETAKTEVSCHRRCVTIKIHINACEKINVLHVTTNHSSAKFKFSMECQHFNNRQ